MAKGSRDLKAPAAVSIAQTMIERHSELIESAAPIMWLLPRIKVALEALQEALRRSSQEATKEQIESYLRHLDVDRHDPLVRAVYYGLLAAHHAALAEQPPNRLRAQELMDVQEVLFPNGLSQTAMAWDLQGPAGVANCDSVVSSQETLLKSFFLGERTGLELVGEYRGVCVEMQKTYAQRASARALTGAEMGVGEARQALLKQISLLIDLLPESGLSEAQQALIRGQFDDAVAAARRRQKSASASSTAEIETGVPATVDPTVEIESLSCEPTASMAQATPANGA